MNFDNYIKKKKINNENDLNDRIVEKMKKKYAYNEDTPLFVWRMFDVLAEALNSRYEPTINALHSTLKNNHSFKLEYRSKENQGLLATLVEEKFKLTDDNYKEFSQADGIFVIASLINDWEGTKKYIKNIKEMDVFNEYDFKILIQIIKEKDPNIESEETKQLIKLMNYNIERNNILVLVNENGKFDKSDYIENQFNLGKDDIKMLIKTIGITQIADIFKLNALKILIDDEEFEKVFLDEIELNQALLGYNKYVEENETKLLNYLSKKGQTYASVEEYVSSCLKDKLITKNLNAEQLVALQIFTEKELHKNGIEGYEVSLFRYKKQDGDYVTYGSQGSNNISLYKSEILDRTSLSKNLLTILHEIEHAVQKKNMKEANIEKDNDIDIYSKDRLLRVLLGELYYNQNYDKILVEFDAQFKAYDKLMKLQNSVEDTFKNAKEEILEELKSAYLKDILKATKPFSRDLCSRDFGDEKNLNIDYLLERTLKGYIDKGKINEFKELVENELPIIGYEYDLKTGTRRSVEQLADLMASAQNEKEKNKYWQLILNRYDIGRFNGPLDALDKIDYSYVNANLSKEQIDLIKKKTHELLKIARTEGEQTKKENLKYKKYIEPIKSMK